MVTRNGQSTSSKSDTNRWRTARRGLAVLNPRPDVRTIKLATRPPQRRILIAHLTERRLSPAAHEAIAVSAAAARRLEEGFDER